MCTHLASPTSIRVPPQRADWLRRVKALESALPDLRTFASLADAASVFILKLSDDAEPNIGLTLGAIKALYAAADSAEATARAAERTKAADVAHKFGQSFRHRFDA